ncbi:Short-chain dehydrogenase/reductase [Parasponia andersonii]|uniref:Short-chain dehydrogenase/reductase n=1 Tax=Parasponia andersonii TaxID=3476 RepID=A0A2P5B4J8_PARAD|nr:Short-chain dehydrogenase/reductase [Parasponia andersonii]
MAFASLLSAVSRRLEGKVALITGGASGLGKKTAEVFAHHGAKPVITDVQDELGHSVRQSIAGNGQNDVTYVHCDVTDESQVKAAVEKAVKAYGKLDIMFNNAGIAGDNKARIIDNDKADFERVLRVNVTGVFLGIKHAAQAMIPARGGSIISTASIGSNAAVELGQFGIRVNCVSPYGVATPLAADFVGLSEGEAEKLFGSMANLKGVTLKPEDIANAALFLASEEGRYVSGHNLVVDGGFTIVNPSLGMFQYPDDHHRDQA